VTPDTNHTTAVGRLRWMVVIAGAVLFASSALRHFLVRSAGGDLGIFDQVVYLISVGATPVSSIMGFHILGDHTAPVWYPLALFYMIYPSVHWLFFVQAAALALGAWPMFLLAKQTGLASPACLLLAAAYLLYPVLYNANLDDFHPEAIAVPAILFTILAARLNRFGWFCGGVLLILSCKEILGLTVLGMGVWLFWWEKQRAYGAVAMLAGLGWFVFAINVAVPYFTGSDAAAVVGDGRYDYLGSTVKGIVANVMTHPWIIVGHIISISSLGYLAGLLSPVLWGLSLRHLGPLVPAVPILMLNLLSDWKFQRHLTNQYSVPIFPFLLVAALSALAAGDTWVRSRRVILAWSVLGFLVFARYPRLVYYFSSIDTWSASREAARRIEPTGGVLTDNCLAPQLTHRVYVQILTEAADAATIPRDADYVLLNARNPCGLTFKAVEQSVGSLDRSAGFARAYDRDGVVLFRRTGADRPRRREPMHQRAVSAGQLLGRALAFARRRGAR
jgi:uncharacterized membrane protein